MKNANDLAALNRMDRKLVETGMAFGRKHGIDTGWGIILGDARRFVIDPKSSIATRRMGSLGLGGLTPRALSKLNRLQLGMKIPLKLASAHRSKKYNDYIYKIRGQRPTKSEHIKGSAIDVQFSPGDFCDDEQSH